MSGSAVRGILIAAGLTFESQLMRSVSNNRRLKAFTTCLLFLAFVTLVGPDAVGQRRRSRVPKPKTKKGKGKVIAIQNELLQVQDIRSGDLWVISPIAASEVEFNASAGKDWIRKGMAVRVTATFDQKGMAVEPVDLVQVFTPVSDDDVGAALQAEKPDRDVPQEYLIAGYIKRIDDEGKLTVHTGKKQFTFAIKDEAEVEVLSLIHISEPT